MQVAPFIYICRLKNRAERDRASARASGRARARSSANAQATASARASPELDLVLVGKGLYSSAQLFSDDH